MPQDGSIPHFGSVATLPIVVLQQLFAVDLTTYCVSDLFLVFDFQSTSLFDLFTFATCYVLLYALHLL